MTRSHETRESWLNAAVETLRHPLRQVGAPVPEKVMASVGFGARNARKALGVCFPTAAGDGIPHVFISPTLTDPVTVLATLVHELIHAADDCKSKHGGDFKRWAKAIGLEGKMTATVPGEALENILTEVADELGEYPHRQLKLTDQVKKQSTRMLKAVCPDGACPLADESGKTYTVRTTAKWVEVGMPSCPCGTPMELEVLVMRIAISPCMVCGSHSTARVETPYARFNACAAHYGSLLDHARLLFTRYRLHSAAGKSELHTYDHDTEAWKVGG